MTTSDYTVRRSLLTTLTALALATACATRPPPAPAETTTPIGACTTPPPPATGDATMDAMPTGPATFTLALLADDLEIVRGERITFDVRIDRAGGFDAPVLIELAGLPDGLTTLARESRAEDALSTITIVSDPDGEPIERAAFVVQASSLEGLRQSAPAHVSVR